MHKGAFARVMNAGKKLVGAAALGVGMAVQQVHAALPTGVDTSITAIQTDATTLGGYVAPVLIAILGMTVGFKLIKRFTNKI